MTLILQEKVFLFSIYLHKIFYTLNILEQPLLIVSTIGFILLVFIIKFYVNRIPDNKQTDQLKMAKRDLKFSNLSTYTFLFLLCLTAVQLKQFTVPAITNFATIAALYLVLEENSSKSRKNVNQLKEKRDLADNFPNKLEDKIDKLEKQIVSLSSAKADFKKELDLLKKENIELKTNIDILKKENSKKSRFSLFTINK